MKPFIRKSFLNTLKYMTFDIIAIIFSYLLTAVLLHMINFRSINNPVYEDAVWFVAIIIGVKLIFYYIFGMYRILTKYTSFEDMSKIILLVLSSNVIIGLGVHLSQFPMINSLTYVVITFIEMTLVLLPRVVRRIWRFFLTSYRHINPHGIPTLIIGAGSAGEIVLREFNTNRELHNLPVAFIDDDKQKIGHRLMGVPVYGPIKNIKVFVEKFHIKEAVVAISALSHQKFQNITEELLQYNVKVKRLNVFNEGNSKPQVVEVKVEDLLERDVICLDNEGIAGFIKDEVVLVTGGGGSIGSELCRQIFNLNPKQLVIFDIYENNAYDIQMELLRLNQNIKNVMKTLN